MPAFYLGALLTLTRIFPDMVMRGWNGLHGRLTETHFGKRSGLVARVYGIFYLGVSVFLIYACYHLARELIVAGAGALLQSVLQRFSAPWETCVFFIGFGLFFLGLMEGLVWLRAHRDAVFAADEDRRRRLRSYLDRHALIPFGFGVLGLLNLPAGIALAAWLAFVYTLPLTVPE